MENNIKKKINVFGKVGKIITTVIIVLMLVVEGFMLAGTVVMAILPKDTVSADVQGSANIKFDAGYFGIDDGKISLLVNDKAIAIGEMDAGFKTQTQDGIVTMEAQSNTLHFNLNTLLGLAIIGMIQLAAFVVALFFLKALMKAFMTCDTPFSGDVISKMRNFAIALIPCMAVHELAGCFAHGFSGGFSIDLVKVGFVVIIFMLTAVFKYGAQLQQQYDETV